MAEALIFDGGIRTLELSDGKGHSIEVSFNPYDVQFFGVIMDAAEELDAKQNELKSVTTDDWTAVYKRSIAIDAEMRDILDGVFDAPVCAALFPKQTVFAVGGGFPAWANLLYAIVDKMDEGAAGEKKLAQQRIRKYSEKYKK